MYQRNLILYLLLLGGEIADFLLKYENSIQNLAADLSELDDTYRGGRAGFNSAISLYRTLDKNNPNHKVEEKDGKVKFPPYAQTQRYSNKALLDMRVHALASPASLAYASTSLVSLICATRVSGHLPSN